MSQTTAASSPRTRTNSGPRAGEDALGLLAVGPFAGPPATFHTSGELLRLLPEEPAGGEAADAVELVLSEDGQPRDLFFYRDRRLFPPGRTLVDYGRLLGELDGAGVEAEKRDDWIARALLEELRTVPTMPLDDFLAERSRERAFAALVLDQPGAEEDILRGAPRFLADSCVMVQIYGPAEDDAAPPEPLLEAGYALLAARPLPERPRWKATIYLRSDGDPKARAAALRASGIEGEAAPPEMRARKAPASRPAPHPAPGADSPSAPSPRPRFAYYGHHKCGTNWVHKIAAALCAEKGLQAARVPGARTAGQLLELADGADFVSYVNARIEIARELGPVPGIHVIRDPRDLIVSAYFSHRYSHSLKTYAGLEQHRNRLNQVSEEEGLLLEMEFSEKHLRMIESWDYNQPHVLELKMEELAKNPYRRFVEVFQFLGLEASLEEVLAAVYHNDFEVLSGGRKKGEENQHHHYRKGTAGDWANYFTDAHREKFHAMYGGLLQKLGYEEDDAW
jgi:hypothetical protein